MKPVATGIIGTVRRQKDGTWLAKSPTGARQATGRTEGEAIAALIQACKDNPIRARPKRRVCS